MDSPASARIFLFVTKRLALSANTNPSGASLAHLMKVGSLKVE